METTPSCLTVVILKGTIYVNHLPGIGGSSLYLFVQHVTNLTGIKVTLTLCNHHSYGNMIFQERINCEGLSEGSITDAQKNDF